MRMSVDDWNAALSRSSAFGLRTREAVGSALRPIDSGAGGERRATRWKQLQQQETHLFVNMDLTTPCVSGHLKTSELRHCAAARGANGSLRRRGTVKCCW